VSEDSRLLPFDLGHGEDAVLLIHGFTGTPYEMRYLGERLASQGFRARGVRLSGHGLDPFVFEQFTADDWIRDCRAALDSLSGARRVFVAGLSMGALLAVLLASDLPERVHGIALLAPAFRFRGLVRLFMRLSRSDLVRRLVPYVPKGASAVLDPEERHRNPNIGRVPTRGALQLGALVSRAERALPNVKAPALVIYSKLDPTVAPAAAFLIANRLGSRPVRMVALKRSLHLITIDRERDEVSTEVGSFFRGIPAGAESPAA
jgi:carboxylesterase